MLLFKSISFLFLAGTVLAAVANPRLPRCSKAYRPCRCPSGTTFKNFTSFAVIGAPAVEVQNIMGDFLNLEFQGGLVPESTTGDGQTSGATRTFHFSNSAGSYRITEELLKWTSKPDGSFNQQYQQSPRPPAVQVPGGGGYYGMWTSIIGEQTLIANETAIAWRNWRCDVGEPFPAATSHENAFTNTSAILQANGLHTGVDIAAFTIFYEVRDD
ncbi:hypothetical protein BDV12DRAFT_173231 [Aspergillus spectabilis]